MLADISPSRRCSGQIRPSRVAERQMYPCRKPTPTGGSDFTSVTNIPPPPQTYEQSRARAKCCEGRWRAG